MIITLIVLFLHRLCCIISDFPMTEKNFPKELRLTVPKKPYWLPWSAWNNFLKHKITYSVFNNSAKSLNCPLNLNFILQIQLPKKRLKHFERWQKHSLQLDCFYRGRISPIVVLLTNFFSNSFSNVKNFLFTAAITTKPFLECHQGIKT